MGNTNLYERNRSLFRVGYNWNVIYNGINRVLDDLGSKVIMAETKLLFFCLTVIGVPAYIYAWFLDITSAAELWKGIILTAIGAFTGMVIGFRQLVRLMKEWREYKEKKN